MSELEISAAEAAVEVERGEAVLVDVREAYEVEEVRIPGARHIALDHLAAEAATLPRDKRVIFQCRSGSRSLMAAQAFQASGYDAVSLDGGIIAWSHAGLPTEA